MRQVKIDHFKEYRFPRMLRPNGAGLVSFICRQANMEKNSYDSNLWLLEPRGARQLTFSNDVSAAWWKDADTLVFHRPQAEDDKKIIQDGLPLTVLQSLSVTRGGEAAELLRLPYAVSDLAFLPDGRMLFVAEHSAKIQAILQKAGQDSKKAAALLAEENNYEVLQQLPFWENGSGFTTGVRQRLYICDGAVTPLVPETTTVSQLRVSPDGRAAFFVAQDYIGKAPVDDRLMRLDLQTLQIRDISAAPHFLHNAYVPVSSEAVLVFGSDMQGYGINQNGNFYRLSLPENRAELLYEGHEYDGWDAVNSDLKMPAEAQWFAIDNMVYWIAQTGANTLLMQIDWQTGEIAPLSAQPGCVSELAHAGDEIVFSAMRGLAGPELYRYSFEDDNEEEATGLNALPSAEYLFSQPEPLSFENSEGNSVRGWVVKPTFFEEGRTYPAILAIHGGPKTAYGTVLFHEMQYWASQGYGVFFCNPTGSSGQGDEFGDLRERYGLIDFDDLMQFTDTVLEQNPWIDPGALGVAGGSYGGFMVNWIIGHTSRFKAAVSQRGISSWATMQTLSDIGCLFVPDQAGADIWTDFNALWEQSPLKFADKATTPTLFLHSEEDYRCPLAEGMQMFSALQSFGVETRLCLFKGENHDLSRTGKPKHRVRRLREITGWFDTYLKQT